MAENPSTDTGHTDRVTPKQRNIPHQLSLFRGNEMPKSKSVNSSPASKENQHRAVSATEEL